MERAIKQKSSTTKWGAIYIEFLSKILGQVKFILRENIKYAKGQDYTDWSIENLIGLINDVVVDARHVFDKLLKNEEEFRDNIDEVIKMGLDYMDMVDNVEPSNEIMQYLIDGIKVLILKINAYETFLKNSLQN